MKSSENCLQLLSFDSATQKFILNEKAIDFLQNLSKPLAITGITGSICSGKSYLLNEITSCHHGGFSVGCKSNPETKGIWILKNPVLSLNQQFYHIFLDAEGLSSTDKDSDYDLKILLFELVICSSLILNQFGAIQQSTLQILKNTFQLKKYCFQKEIKQINFADLIWIARDFNLAIIDQEGNQLSENEYLETALKDIDGNSSEITLKNQTRRILRSIFPHRSCFTLPRPAVNQSALRSLSVNSKKVKPQFISKIAQIRQSIMCHSQPKQLNCTSIDPSMLISIMRSILKTINSIGNIESKSWNSIALQNNEKVFSNCLKGFNSRLCSLDLPVDVTSLKQIIKNILIQSQKQYTRKVVHGQACDGIDQLRSAMQKEVDQLMETNNALLKKSYKEQFQMMWSQSSIEQFLGDPFMLKDQLKSLKSKLQHKEQWAKYSQNLQQLLISTSIRLKHDSHDRQQYSNELRKMFNLKNDYKELKDLHTSTLLNVGAMQERIQVLDRSINTLEDQKREFKNKYGDIKVLLDAQNLRNKRLGQSLQESSTKIAQMKSKIKQLQQNYQQKSQQAQYQLKLYLKQKTVFEQQERLYLRQIQQLKQNLIVAKNNYDRSNQNLLQNNQILKRLEIIKNLDTQKKVSSRKEKENIDAEEIRTKQLNIQIAVLEEKTKKMQVNVIELSERVRKEQQSNVSLRCQLNSQLQLNKELQSSKRTFEEMVESLETNLAVIGAAQQREKTLYEESIIRLLENIQRREEQYHRKQRKSELRQRMSRHQF